MNYLATPNVQDKAQGLLCPACRVNLVMSERQSIEIDYCPNCRGVWLDRGELDKIIDRSLTAEPPVAQRSGIAKSQPFAPHYPDEDHRDGGHGSGHGAHGQNRRHGSFLGRLFD